MNPFVCCHHAKAKLSIELGGMNVITFPMISVESMDSFWTNKGFSKE